MKKKATRSKAGKRAAFRLVPVTRRDFEAWKRMREDLYSGVDPAYNRREMEWMLESGEKKGLFIKAPNDETVGFLEVSLRNVVDGCIGSPVGYIEGIYLTPEFRGLGLGPLLLEAAAAWFKEKGCRDMATDTEIDNDAAQAFWAELGFEETWRIVQYRKPIRPARASRRR